MSTTKFRELIVGITTELAGRPLAEAQVLYLLPQGSITFTPLSSTTS